MTTVSIILAVALFLLVQASMKWGLVRAMRGAGAVLFCAPAVWLTGLIIPGALRSFGFKAPRPWVWILGGLLIFLAARWIAGKVGWGNVLGWSIGAAVGFCFIVVCLFLFLVIAAGLHMTVQGMLFILVGTPIVYIIFSKHAARGR